MKLSEFVCITACALHDAHKALRWAMQGSLTDKELVRDIFTVFESLRRSADTFSSHIHQWIGQRLHPQLARGAAWVRERMTFWSDLGVDPQTAELLAAQLQFVWADDHIYYLAGACFAGYICDSFASALVAVWRFPHFTESRWLTVGTSCRTMVASLLTGIESLVRFVKRQGASLWFLKGFDRLQLPLNEFLVTFRHCQPGARGCPGGIDAAQ